MPVLARLLVWWQHKGCGVKTGIAV
jgi:hypothetical protein